MCKSKCKFFLFFLTLAFIASPSSPLDVFRITPPSRAILRYMIYCEITPLMYSFDNDMFAGKKQ